MTVKITGSFSIYPVCFIIENCRAQWSKIDHAPSNPTTHSKEVETLRSTFGIIRIAHQLLLRSSMVRDRNCYPGHRYWYLPAFFRMVAYHSSGSYYFRNDNIFHGYCKYIAHVDLLPTKRFWKRAVRSSQNTPHNLKVFNK